MQKAKDSIVHNKFFSLSIVIAIILFMAVGIWMISQPSEITKRNSFKDDFSSNDPSKYIRTGGKWIVANGTAIISEPVLAQPSALGVTNINLFKNSDGGFSDWKLKVEAKITSTKASPADVAIIFNYKNVNNYYYVDYTVNGGSIRKVVGGKETTLTSFSDVIALNKNTKFEVRRKGSDYKVYIGSHYTAKIDDSSITNGMVGIGSKNSVVQFDNFSFDVKGKEVTPAPVVPAPDDPVVPPSTPPAPTPTPAPQPTGKVINVTNGDELSKQLLAATPGTTIQLAPGAYKVAKSSQVNGNAARFIATAVGTESAPITITGPATAILDGAGTSGNYALYFANARYWNVKGISIANASKGIVMDKSSHIIIDGVHVYNIGQEGVHFRDFTTSSIIQNSLVENTGLGKPQFGEGVYIGSAESNWKKDSATGKGIPDNSDLNTVFNNTIKNTTAENIDIKEGTRLGVIRANTLDAVGMGVLKNGVMEVVNFADSMIDVKGNEYIITENKGSRSGKSAMIDGFQVHQILSGWGNDNDFSSNQFTISSPAINGYAINVQTKGSGNSVYANNTYTNFTKGLTNITVSK